MRPIRCIYLSGPMTGLPDLNFPAFRTAARALNRAGYVVVNPVDVNPDPTTSRYDCMRNDLRAMADCDAIALLPGWEHSPGANRELHNALSMGFVAAPLDAWLAGADEA